MSSGFPLLFNDHYINKIEQYNLSIQTLNGKHYLGDSIDGKVYYVDYSNPDSTQITYQLREDFTNEMRSDKFGIQSIRNEISKELCTYESCYPNYQSMPAESWLNVKPGNNRMTVNTFEEVRRVLGIES